jgi:hypothetical protein
VDQRVVGFQELARESLGGGVGKFKTVFGVPVPIPEVDGETVEEKTVFTVQVRRGHTHRFEIFAAGTATSGLGGATVDFVDLLPPPIPQIFPGRIEAQNVTMDVSPSDADILLNLLSRVEALESGLTDLGQQVDGLAGGIQEQIEGLQLSLSELSVRFDDHTHNCVLKPGRSPSGNAMSFSLFLYPVRHGFGACVKTTARLPRRGNP